MTIFGIDLGVRTFYAAGLDDRGRLRLYSHFPRLHGKVKDQLPGERAIELVTLSASVRAIVEPGDQVFIEEPPLAGGKNVRTFLKLSQASAAVAVGASLASDIRFVPVDTWKKEVTGRGGTHKELVADWLQYHHPNYFRQCAGDQNYIDAACLAIYGRREVQRAAESGGMDQPDHELAAG